VIPPGTAIPVLDRDVLRLMLQQDKTYFPPGAKYRYSNTAYALLSLMVEVRSGKTFAAFLKENIFEPLQMTNTLAYEQGISVVPQRAFGYTIPLTRPSATFSAADGESGIQRTDQSLTSAVLGDGGVYSSAVDLFKWDQALYTTTLVSAATLQQAFSPTTPTDKPDRHYGFGWYISEYRGLKEFWHSGETCGFTTGLARFPEKKFTVIILTNRRDAHLDGLPERIADMYLASPH
jgi:CubicO group peptidase (beta-lactamase class C family)